MFGKKTSIEVSSSGGGEGTAKYCHGKDQGADFL